MAERITPFLMFEGQAEQAMNLYVSLFPDARIERLERFGPDGPGGFGVEGQVQHAEFVIAGQRVRMFDSSVPHGFVLTPSFSFFVDCESEEEVDRLFGALSEGGAVMMALAEYPFARKYAWLADRFGVSWQLSLTD